jgi:hypothetical protein
MRAALEGFPQKLVGMVDGERREWVARPGWCAVCTPGDRTGEPQVTLRKGAPELQRGEPGAETAPAYAVTPQAAPLAPTGQVFVRFEPGSDAASRAADLAAAGFVIAEVPAYAPHAAWVRAASGSLRDALAGLERLLALPGICAVEPQLVGERRWRE